MTTRRLTRSLARHSTGDFASHQCLTPRSNTEFRNLFFPGLSNEPMRISNKTVAYALLRGAFGVNFLGHGVFRILSGTGKFAAMMADSMAKSPLPHGLTLGFLSAVPVIETVL